MKTIVGDGKGAAGHPETYGLTRTLGRSDFFRWAAWIESGCGGLCWCGRIELICVSMILDKHCTPAPYTHPRTPRRFAVYMAYGVWHSLAMFFICFYALAAWPSVNRNGAPSDLATAGTAVFVALIIIVTLKLSIRTRHWNWVTWLVYGLSLALMLPFIYVLGFLWPRAGIEGVADMTGACVFVCGVVRVCGGG